MTPGSGAESGPGREGAVSGTSRYGGYTEEEEEEKTE